MPKVIGLTGQRFNRLVVLRRVENDNEGRAMWLCKCDCGNERVVCGKLLRNGHAQSCGRLHHENLSRGNIVHGGRRDRLYKVYANMKNRCYNKNSSNYKYYGARGIVICDEWLESYLAFKEWAYANGYDDSAGRGECTIDRIDVNGDYDPQNCRWVGLAEQSRNRRNVRVKTK